MSYKKMKEISKLAKEKGINLETISDFLKFAKKFNYKEK